MNFRTKPYVKAAIERAAALSGLIVSTFVVYAAYRSATEIFAAHQRTLLQPIDHEAFFSGMDATPWPTSNLQRAFKGQNKRPKDAGESNASGIQRD